jgi:hypothetical protein
MKNSEWDKDLIANIISEYMRMNGKSNIKEIKKVLKESGIGATDQVIESRVKMYLDRNGVKKND